MSEEEKKPLIEETDISVEIVLLRKENTRNG